MNEVTLIALAELVDPVRAAGEGEHDCQGEEAQERAGPGAPGDLGGAGLPPSAFGHLGIAAAPAPRAVGSAPDGAAVPDQVVDEQDAEHKERHHLKRQAGEGDVDAGFVGAGRRGGEGAAGGLQDQGHDVEWDEDPVEEFGREAGEGGGEGIDAGEALVS